MRLADIPNSEFAASSSLDMSDKGSQDSVGPPLKGWTVVTQSGDVEVSEWVCVCSQESVGPPLKDWTVVTQSGDVEVSVCVCVCVCAHRRVWVHHSRTGQL